MLVVKLVQDMRWAARCRQSRPVRGWGSPRTGTCSRPLRLLDHGLRREFRAWHV